MCLDGDWLQVHLQGARAESVGDGSRQRRCIRRGTVEDLPRWQGAQSLCAPGSGLWAWYAAPCALVWRSVSGEGLGALPQHSSLKASQRPHYSTEAGSRLKSRACNGHDLGRLQRQQGCPRGHHAELRLGIAQAPHRAVKEGGALPESCGVFVSRWHHGSPAHRYALYALQFVQEVNGVPTPDLEAFVKAISTLVRIMRMERAVSSSTRTATGIKRQKPTPFWALAADGLKPLIPDMQSDHQ